MAMAGRIYIGGSFITSVEELAKALRVEPVELILKSSRDSMIECSRVVAIADHNLSNIEVYQEYNESKGQVSVRNISKFLVDTYRRAGGYILILSDPWQIDVEVTKATIENLTKSIEKNEEYLIDPWKEYEARKKDFEKKLKKSHDVTKYQIEKAKTELPIFKNELEVAKDKLLELLRENKNREGN